MKIIYLTLVLFLKTTLALIAQCPTPPYTYIVGSNTLCSGSTNSLSVVYGSNGFNYGNITGFVWERNYGNYQLPNSNSQSIDISQGGSYSAIIYTESGCSWRSQYFDVTEFTSPQNVSISISGSQPYSFCENQQQGVRIFIHADGYIINQNYSFTFYYRLYRNNQLIDEKGDLDGSNAYFDFSQPGTYKVAVSNYYGCTVMSNEIEILPFVINPLPSAVITASGPTSFCPGGSVTLTASTGTSYLWSTGQTTQSIAVSSAGTKYVRVTNSNGCSATSTPITITVNSIPSISISGPSTACNSTVLSASGGTSYSWSGPGISGSGTSKTVYYTGWYYVTGYNAAGCSSTTSKYLTINPNPTVSIYKSSGNICNGYVYATASATAGSTYSWPAAYPYPYSTSATVPVQAGQTRSVIVTKNGCSASASYYAGYCSGGGGSGGGGSGGGGGGGTPRIAADQEPKIPGIYPNPVDKELNIVLDTAVEVLSKIQLSDMSGRVLKVGSIDPGNIDATILMEDVPDGIYLLAVLSDSRKKYLKIIVKHNK